MGKIFYSKGVIVPHGTHRGRNVIIASDHRGYEMKKELVDFLRGEKMKVEDIGTDSQDRCNYPQISWDLGRMISQDSSYNTVGIGICGSGIGIGIPASKWPGVYTARCLTPDEASTSRKHNNSNLLTLGADVIQLGKAIKIVDAWLWESFDPKEPYLSRYIQSVQLTRKVF